jgi:hypothetical protein
LYYVMYAVSVQLGMISGVVAAAYM